MRAIMALFLAGACLQLTGCKHASPSAEAKSRGTTANASARGAGKNGTRETTPAPQSTAVNEATGKVASVNPGLRFVVIDFAFNPPPAPDQRMSVYRAGQKVGEVKISAQARNSIVAADITAGEAMAGDEIRP